MGFRDEADYIVQTSAGGVNGGNFAFEIGSDMEDVSGQWMQTSAAPSATDEQGALAGFSGNTQTQSSQNNITRDGTDLGRIDLPAFVISGTEVTPSYIWELKQIVAVSATGQQQFLYKIWRKTKGDSMRTWTTNTGAWEWSSTGGSQENIDRFNRIVVVFYANEAMNSGVGQSESYELAEDFVNNSQRNGGAAMAGIGIAVLAGLALFVLTRGA